jgi:hypothetical protein
MSREFLDFVEDILDAMNKAEVLVKGSAMLSSPPISGSTSQSYVP